MICDDMNSKKHEFLVLGSTCTRTMAFFEMVKELVSALAVDASVHVRNFGFSDVNDPMLIDHELNYRCRIVYCPGCNFHPPCPDTKFLPALLADGVLLTHSGVPTEAECEKIIKDYLQL